MAASFWAPTFRTWHLFFSGCGRFDLWHIGSSIYGTHINLRHPSVHRRQSRGIRPDIPLCPHPARHPVLEPVGSLQVPGRFPLGGGHRPSVRHECADPAQTHPLGGSSLRRHRPFCFICRPSGASVRSCRPCSSSARRLQGLWGGRSSGTGATRPPVRKAPPRTRGAAASFRPARERLAQPPLSFPATAPAGPEGPMRCESSRCLSACR